MDRESYRKHFSNRLVALLKKKGYTNSRASTGVDTLTLSKLSGCSYQMARKYLIGDAIPELPYILELCDILNVSPNELLGHPPKDDHTLIQLDKALFQHIFTTVSIAYGTPLSQKNIDFIMASIYDIMHLNVDKPTLYKLIETSIHSSTLFHEESQNDHQDCINK